jgi:hypothetical protein
MLNEFAMKKLTVIAADFVGATSVIAELNQPAEDAFIDRTIPDYNGEQLQDLACWRRVFAKICKECLDVLEPERN